MATASTIRRNLPFLAGATLVTVAGVRYFATSRPLLLDSGATFAQPGYIQRMEAKNTLSFPRSMLFSKELTVSKIEQVNHDTKRITLALPGGFEEISGVPAGGAILTQHTPKGAWLPVLRPYTPISPASTRGEVELLVKQYRNGAGSTYMHSLQPGQKVTIRGPTPSYTWVPSPTPRDVLFIAGGAGITPLYSLTKSILANPDDKARIQLVWGVNGTQDIVLRKELDGLEKQYPDRLKVTYCISKPNGSLEVSDRLRKGYVDRGVLQDVVRQLDSGRWGDKKGTKVFLCGPPGMQEDIAGRNGTLKDLGVEWKQVHKF